MSGKDGFFAATMAMEAAAAAAAPRAGEAGAAGAGRGSANLSIIDSEGLLGNGSGRLIARLPPR